MLAEMPSVSNGVDELIADVLRVRGHKPHAANALHFVHHPEEVGKIRRLMILSIGIDILPEERHLGISLRDRAAHLRHDVLRRAAALAPAHIGNNAERTEIITSVHDRHPRRELPAARDGQVLHDRIPDDRIDDGRSLRANLRDDARQLLHLARTEHEVDVRCALHEVVPFFLRHAACDAEDEVRIAFLELFDLADFAVDLVLR